MKNLGTGLVASAYRDDDAAAAFVTPGTDHVLLRSLLTAVEEA